MKFLNKGVNEKEADFMSKMRKHFPYKEMTIAGQAVKVLEMPYVADSMSMVILLPQMNDSLQKILSAERITSDLTSLLETGLNDLKRTEMNLYIPKFRLETDYSLIPTLSQLGIRKVFTGGEADLSGVNGKNNLYVSKIKHKAVVQVSEDGTEAAAVTFFDMYPMSGSSVYIPPVDFVADHPFLFLIRNKETGLVLFIGKVEEI